MTPPSFLCVRTWKRSVKRAEEAEEVVEERKKNRKNLRVDEVFKLILGVGD